MEDTGLSLFQRVWGHIKTITKHHHEVMKLCFKAGIPIQGLFHDLSKLSPSEFIIGVKYYNGRRSPNECEREVNGYSSGWMHHKGRNKHHFEYWTDYDANTGKPVSVEMPVKYLVEMFCDRVAACKVYNGDAYNDNQPYEYWFRSKGDNQIHPVTACGLENLLRILAEEGEDTTFDLIREMIKR